MEEGQGDRQTGVPQDQDIFQISHGGFQAPIKKYETVGCDQQNLNENLGVEVNSLI